MWFTQLCRNFNFVVIYAFFLPNPKSQIFRIDQKIVFSNSEWELVSVSESYCFGAIIHKPQEIDLSPVCRISYLYLYHIMFICLWKRHLFCSTPLAYITLVHVQNNVNQWMMDGTAWQLIQSRLSKRNFVCGDQIRAIKTCCTQIDKTQQKLPTNINKKKYCVQI